jgi:hypothetical protein
VPPVVHFPHVGIVGALSLACTTRAARTRPLTGRRRIWSTLPCCPSVRQRNVNPAELHLERHSSCPTPWGHRSAQVASGAARH